jgi:hypothetical protein
MLSGSPPIPKQTWSDFRVTDEALAELDRREREQERERAEGFVRFVRLEMRIRRLYGVQPSVRRSSPAARRTPGVRSGAARRRTAARGSPARSSTGGDDPEPEDVEAPSGAGVSVPAARSVRLSDIPERPLRGLRPWYADDPAGRRRLAQAQELARLRQRLERGSYNALLLDRLALQCELDDGREQMTAGELVRLFRDVQGVPEEQAVFEALAIVDGRAAQLRRALGEDVW